MMYSVAKFYKLWKLAILSMIKKEHDLFLVQKPKPETLNVLTLFIELEHQFLPSKIRTSIFENCHRVSKIKLFKINWL